MRKTKKANKKKTKMNSNSIRINKVKVVIILTKDIKIRNGADSKCGAHQQRNKVRAQMLTHFLIRWVTHPDRTINRPTINLTRLMMAVVKTWSSKNLNEISIFLYV